MLHRYNFWKKWKRFESLYTKKVLWLPPLASSFQTWDAPRLLEYHRILLLLPECNPFTLWVLPCPTPEAEFLDIIGTKVVIVFPLAIHSHLYCTNGFYPVWNRVCNVNTVYGNLKSENSQDYAQKAQRNCMFMNLASALGVLPAKDKHISRYPFTYTEYYRNWPLCMWNKWIFLLWQTHFGRTAPEILLRRPSFRWN